MNRKNEENESCVDELMMMLMESDVSTDLENTYDNDDSHSFDECDHFSEVSDPMTPLTPTSSPSTSLIVPRSLSFSCPCESPQIIVPTTTHPHDTWCCKDQYIEFIIYDIYLQDICSVINDSKHAHRLYVLFRKSYIPHLLWSHFVAFIYDYVIHVDDHTFAKWIQDTKDLGSIKLFYQIQPTTKMGALLPIVTQRYQRGETLQQVREKKKRLHIITYR